MNHTCCGDIIAIEGVLYWRCLLNGTLWPLTASFFPDSCPNCHRRRTANSEELLVAETRTVKMYRYSDYQWAILDDNIMKVDNESKETDRKSHRD